ncbi:MAG TPA: SAM-dependent methyltransferase [Kineosporiaceae bacterium]|nr:SAM-dependent methyltransferase [Kineosporiaceae bacterium]
MTIRQSPDGEPEIDWAWTDDNSSWIPPQIDTERPSPARMYDYALGGKDNFEVDRAAVESVAEILPEFRQVALANRGFLVRAVNTLADLGIDQFIDLGTGIPTSPNVHQIAQHVHPHAKVVYVDNDPIVMAHNRALRSRWPGVLTVLRDLREPASVIDSEEVRNHLDFDRPIAVLFVAVLHFVHRDLGVEVVTQFRQALPAGSYVAISTACLDGMAPALVNRLEQVYAKSPAPLELRTTEQIEQLFEGLDLLPPGLKDVTQWRGDEKPLPIRILSGVGKVTAVGG